MRLRFTGCRVHCACCACSGAERGGGGRSINQRGGVAGEDEEERSHLSAQAKQ